MTPKRRQEIQEQWAAIDRELAYLAEGKVIPHVEDLAGREGKLLREQDALEYELGENYFKDRKPNVDYNEIQNTRREAKM